MSAARPPAKGVAPLVPLNGWKAWLSSFLHSDETSTEPATQVLVGAMRSGFTRPSSAGPAHCPVMSGGVEVSITGKAPTPIAHRARAGDATLPPGTWFAFPWAAITAAPHANALSAATLIAER